MLLAPIVRVSAGQVTSRLAEETLRVNSYLHASSQEPLLATVPPPLPCGVISYAFVCACAVCAYKILTVPSAPRYWLVPTPLFCTISLSPCWTATALMVRFMLFCSQRGWCRCTVLTTVVVEHITYGYQIYDVCLVY